MTKSFKQQATDTCVEAITSSSVNLVEAVATSLIALHAGQGINEPLKFSEADAKRIAFDARVAFNKAKGVAYPKKMKYDTGKDGGFASFRARELELTKIVQNVQHYTEAKKACDDLVKVNCFRQSGASEVVRAMAAIGGGKSVDDFKTAAIKSKSDRSDNKEAANAKAITVDGFNEALEALIEKASEHRVILSEDGKTFVALPPEKPAEKIIEAAPDAAPVVFDDAEMQKLMGLPTYQAASQSQQIVMMAAFLRR